MSSETEAAALFGRTAAAYVPPARTMAYGEHPAQVIDVYEPVRRPGQSGAAGQSGATGQSGAAGQSGVRVSVLHGGFWREAYDRRHLAPFAAALAARGYQVELVEYRRVGGGGGWPRTAQDVDAALDRLGAPPQVLLGHSAGGQLALWAAATRERAASARVLAVAPVADLARAHELRLSGGAVQEFLGSADGAGEGEDFTERLRAADPMKLMPRVPVEILHGTGDEDVPVELSRRYASDWGARLHLQPCGHFAPLTPNTPAFEALAATLPKVEP
ncbi:alpha/beta fold hydrolase [Streptomyces oceani]|uniref:Lipase n=1 Tax=Streptomyces oceani TaxID=1075402 RepID=A0A1E7JXJ3_9ACTN|nr:alpha/beta fold hydrolase [Streptomyces oceani]OEU96374.1 lipase [Streptomyces oceani]